MIKSITITNFLGEELKVTLTEAMPSHGLLVRSIEGLGPVKANISTTDLSTADGSVYNSSRLDERNIVINFLFFGNPLIEDARQLTYKYFPLKKELTFKIETDNRVAEAYGYVESNEPDIFSEQEGCQISIICPDQFFYSASEDEKNWTVFSGIEALFEFPFSNEDLHGHLIEFGSIENATERTIYYEGDTDVGIIMYIHAIGEVGTITIYNTLTRESMIIDADKIASLTGSRIKAGDDIIINTNRGQKSVYLLRSGVYTNILNALGRDADWFVISKGDNVFTYIADSGSSNLLFRIYGRTIFEGV